jgi:penicillin-binding protein 1C
MSKTSQREDSKKSTKSKLSFSKRLWGIFLKKSSTNKKTKSSFSKYLGSTFFSRTSIKWYLIVVFVLITGSLFFILKDIPNPQKLIKSPAPISTKILDRHGVLLYEVFQGYRRSPVKLESINKHAQLATISIEDKNFYRHYGLDTSGIIRASLSILTGKRLEGGSTLTQQLVKIAILSDSRRTLDRKIKEAVLAVATEIVYTKDQILELYLNHAPYGGTIYGIEAASREYFDKKSSELTLAEAALLAGLPQSPTRYSPYGANPQLAISRQREVLRRMYEDGHITLDQLTEARDSTPSFSTKKISIQAPHFSLFVRDLLVQRYGEDQVNLGGLIVTTTLDLDLQRRFEASLSAELKKIERLKISNGASIVTVPSTGEIISLIGSKDYFNATIDGQVNIVTAQRQPGSSIKPLNYATALLLGWPTSLHYLDTPICFTQAGQTPYCPRNYDNSFRGLVSMRYSLANSLNIPAVKQLALNSLESFIATASAMGISSWQDTSRYGLSLTLGGGEVSMHDMAVSFSSLANLGVSVPLQPILEVRTYTGEILEKYDPQATLAQVRTMTSNYSDFLSSPPDYDSPLKTPTTTLPQEVSYIISDILADNQARTPTFGSNSNLNIPGFRVSAKTGTTNNLKDNWTIGYTPDYLVAIWVGNNDNTSMSYVASGVTGASPIWNSIMTYLLKSSDSQTVYEKPDGVISYQVCRNTGAIARVENQCETENELFIKGINPKEIEIKREQIWVRRSDQYPIFPGDETIDRDLVERTLASDLFTRDYCIDCTYSQLDSEKPSWPSTTININDLYRIRQSFLTNTQ